MLLLALLVVAAAALTWMNFSQALPRSQWAQAAWSPDIDVIEQMIFHYSLLPRLAISLLVGAGLGLVGVLFQQVLRNPLAEPTTLGVNRRATGDYRHHALGNPRRDGEPVCCAGRGLCCWLNRLWRRVGETLFAGNADPRGGSEPHCRAQSISYWLSSIMTNCKACSCGAPER